MIKTFIENISFAEKESHLSTIAELSTKSKYKRIYMSHAKTNNRTSVKTNHGKEEATEMLRVCLEYLTRKETVDFINTRNRPVRPDFQDL